MPDKRLWGGPYCREAQEPAIAGLMDYVDALEEAKNTLLESLADSQSYEDGEELTDEVLPLIAEIDLIAKRLADGAILHEKELNARPEESAIDKRLRQQNERFGNKDRS